MLADPLERQARLVLAEYDIPVRSLTSLGSAGGFSGARIWRVESLVGDWRLKAWPPSTMNLSRLAAIHARMISARSAQLDFVPFVATRRDGSTCTDLDGCAWDLVSWMPGKADFNSQPSSARMIAAMSGLSKLHVHWREGSLRHGLCPAIQRRLERLDVWDETLRSGWRPKFAIVDRDPFGELAEQAWRELPPRLSEARALLGPRREAPYPLHTCLGDIWHDHVLFEGDELTALIDFGAVRIDTPMVDLARLLGSLAPTADDLYSIGLQSYRTRISLSPEELSLLDILDYSGTAIGAANWLLWVYRDGRQLEDRAAASRRLSTLLGRLRHLCRPLLQSGK